MNNYKEVAKLAAESISDMYNISKYDVYDIICEAIATDITEGSKIEINFFGKEWNAELELFSNSIELTPEIKSIIKKFISKSNSISKKLEKKFIMDCMKWPDWKEAARYGGLPQRLTSYDDFPVLTVEGIGVDKTNSGKTVIVLYGNFSADTEHGWAHAFINNQPVGNLSSSGSIHDEYLDL